MPRKFARDCPYLPTAPNLSMPSFLTLPGKRIKLRPLENRDARALFELYADPEVMRYWNHAPWRSIDQASTAITEAQRDYLSGASLHCAIEHSTTGLLIGSCALYAINPQHRCASLGYLLSKQYWGQGFMSESTRVLLDYGFSDLHLNRVEADVNQCNTGSRLALERLGFQHEGCMRERWIVGEKKCDTEAYALIRHDWLTSSAARQRQP